MKNPLKPTFRERERDPDRTELEHYPDLRLMMNLDEKRSYEPLEEFSKHGVPMAGSSPVPISVQADFEGSVFVESNTKRFMVQQKTGSRLTPIQTAAAIEQMKWLVAELEAKHGKLKPYDVLNISARTEQDPSPARLLDGAVRAADWLTDAKARKIARKRLADENADLQEAYREGRKILICWRKFWLWAWLAAQFTTPVYNAVKKVPAKVWATVLWLLR